MNCPICHREYRSFLIMGVQFNSPVCGCRQAEENDIVEPFRFDKSSVPVKHRSGIHRPIMSKIHPKIVELSDRSVVPNIIACGPTNGGKSFDFVWLVSRRIVNRKQTWHICGIDQHISDLMTDNKYLNWVFNVDYLILEDIHTAKGGQLDRLFALCDYRATNGYPTFFSHNLTNERLFSIFGMPQLETRILQKDVDGTPQAEVIVK